MPSSASRLRTVIAEQGRRPRQSRDRRRARLPRSNLYRFAQGDSRQLLGSLGRIAILYEKVTGKPPPPEQ
jgi:hypothetical protein